MLLNFKGVILHFYMFIKVKELLIWYLDWVK